MPDQHARFDHEVAQRLHEALIERLVREGYLNDPAIYAAFRALPRHHFLPGRPLEQVYSDQAIVLKRSGDEWLSSSSQPAMMAIMLEQLELRPAMAVLEIGTGTGYNAALIDHIVGPQGRVLSLELESDLAAAARRNLATVGVTRVEVRHADGATGAPDAAPFDRIIVTAGVWDLLPSWQAQLAPSGRIVLPMTMLPGLTLSLALERHDEAWVARSARPCGFVLLRGAEAHPGQPPGSPQITLQPRKRRAGRRTIRALIERDWSRIEIVWEQ